MVTLWTRMEDAQDVTIEFVTVHEPPMIPAKFPPVMFWRAVKPVVHRNL